jgi:hypothetical protein
MWENNTKDNPRGKNLGEMRPTAIGSGTASLAPLAQSGYFLFPIRSSWEHVVSPSTRVILVAQHQGGRQDRTKDRTSELRAKSLGALTGLGLNRANGKHLMRSMMLLLSISVVYLRRHVLCVCKHCRCSCVQLYLPKPTPLLQQHSLLPTSIIRCVGHRQ